VKINAWIYIDLSMRCVLRQKSNPHGSPSILSQGIFVWGITSGGEYVGDSVSSSKPGGSFACNQFNHHLTSSRQPQTLLLLQLRVGFCHDREIFSPADPASFWPTSWHDCALRKFTFLLLSFLTLGRAADDSRLHSELKIVNTG